MRNLTGYRLKFCFARFWSRLLEVGRVFSYFTTRQRQLPVIYMRPRLSASVNTDDTQPCTHQFANCSADETVVCLWLECDGEEREYHRLPPGHATAQSEGLLR